MEKKCHSMTQTFSYWKAICKKAEKCMQLYTTMFYSHIYRQCSPA